MPTNSLELAIRICTLAAQVAIPVAIFLAGRSIARAQYVKSTQDAWNEFNKLVVANSDNVRVARQNFAFSWTKDSDDAFRKAHMGFAALNAFMTVYYGAKHGLLPPEYKDSNIDQLLKVFLADEEIFELTQTRGYPPEFRALCARIKASLGVTQSAA